MMEIDLLSNCQEYPNWETVVLQHNEDVKNAALLPSLRGIKLNSMSTRQSGET